MKTRLLILSVFGLLVISSFGALPKTYLGETDSWLISSFSAWGGKFKELNYVLKADSVISLKRYKKIYAVDSPSANYLGGLREENRKWFFLPVGKTKESLLYDFSLNVGDTISVNLDHPFDAGRVTFQVVKVDSVYLNGMFRKRIAVGEYNQFSLPYVSNSWIEGVGSEQGLFYNPPGIIDLDDYELICYHHNNDLVYLNPKYNSCSLTPSKNVSYLKEGDSWSVVGSNGSWYGGGNNENYTIVGEKLINGFLYKNVVVTADSIYNSAQSRFAFNIREDKGKWFYYNSSLSKEVLLYDFNLQEGDTIITSWSGFNATLKVMKVDSLLLNGQWRKRLQMGQHNPYSGTDYFLHYWIEGIGSDDGILYSTELLMDSGSTLLCFHQNGVLVYINPNFNRCGIISGIENSKIAIPLIVKNIDSSQGGFEVLSRDYIEELTVTDIRGVVVSQLYPSGNSATVSLKNFPKGVYVLRVKTEKGVLTRKIVRK
ncbi:MAG: T9SS type A sorting domain-containing protein [Bacteroidales bacterium]